MRGVNMMLIAILISGMELLRRYSRNYPWSVDVELVKMRGILSHWIDDYDAICIALYFIF
jgi:hypothetical protein